MKKLIAFMRILGKNTTSSDFSKSDILNLIENINAEVEKRIKEFPSTLRSVSVRKKLDTIAQKNQMYLHDFFERLEDITDFQELHGKIVEYRVIVVNILTHLETSPSFDFEEMYAGNFPAYDLAMKYIQGFNKKVLEANLTADYFVNAQTMRSQVLRDICLQIKKEGQTYENSKILLERAKLLPQNYQAFKEALVATGVITNKKSLQYIAPPSE